MKNPFFIFWFAFFASTQIYLHSEIVQAQSNTGGPAGNFTFGVNYGVGLISPGDINSISGNLGGSPSLSSINHSTFYGGFIGYRFLPAFEVEISYQIESATNVAATSLGSSSGFTLSQNEFWFSPNYYFLLSSSFYSYVGMGVGYPFYSHVSENIGGTQNEYNATQTFGVSAQLGAGLLLGDYSALFIRVAYEEVVSGIVAGSSGLTTPIGNSAVLDFSGVRIGGGLQFFF